jgi:hypothetical protein
MDALVSFGSKAPFWQSIGHFRSTPMNRHHQSRLACLKRPGPAFKPLWRQLMPDAFSRQ